MSKVYLFFYSWILCIGNTNSKAFNKKQLLKLNEKGVLNLSLKYLLPPVSSRHLPESHVPSCILQGGDVRPLPDSWLG